MRHVAPDPGNPAQIRNPAQPWNPAQLDLFLDTAETLAVNDLRDALWRGDAASAGTLRERLHGIDPHHPTLPRAAALIQALGAPTPRDEDEAAARLDTLERVWEPAARALWPDAADGFLTPLWRAAGSALEGAAFDPGRPRRHSSWAYGKGLDWESVRRTVRSAAGFRSEPVLLHRLAEAEHRLRRGTAALELWFTLCWRSPTYFEEMVEQEGFPDESLKEAWRRALDDDLEPPMSPPWFPAWMALRDPGIARAAAPRGGATPPERAFDLALALAADVQDIHKRKALQEIHPGLLAGWLKPLHT